MPLNCFKIDITCITCGGKAGTKLGTTYGGAGGGGGLVKLSDFLIMQGSEPADFGVSITSVGLIEVVILSLALITIEPGGNGSNAKDDKGSPVQGGIGSKPIFSNYFGGTFICNNGTDGGGGGAATLAPYPGTITGCCNPGNKGIGQREQGDLIYSSQSFIIVTYYLYN